MKKKNWYRLDNAAKIYPPCSNYRRAGNFTLSALLTEDVNNIVLEKAVNNVLKRFPSINVKLKKGVFWYYFEENNKKFEVREEEPYFLKYIDSKENNGFLFKVYYRKNKISLVVFHALSDGGGALDVFKSLLYEYLILSGKKVSSGGLIKTVHSPSTLEETTDDFLTTYQHKKIKVEKEKSAFKTYGTPFQYDGVGLITGKLSVTQLKSLAKRHNTTITILITAFYMQAIYEAMIKDKKIKNKLVKILVPVNLRKFFPSHTLRNFAMFARLSHDFTKPITLEECIETLSDQLKQKTDKETLYSHMHSHVKTEKNIFLKIVPLFIKDVAMRIAYKYVGDNLHTANVSNLGVVELPKSMQPYVKEFIFALNASYSGKHNMAVISYNDVLNITCTRAFAETTIEQNFFVLLAKNGVDVEVSSNYWEAEHETL